MSVCALVSGLTAAGCSESKRRPAPASTAAAVSSASTPAPTTSSSTTPVATPAPSLSASGQLTGAFKQAVAQAFAPQLRYNAYHNDGNTSEQNRSEDFFPMGVASFLREIASGQARVVTTGSRGTQPGVSEVRPFTNAAVFRNAYLDGYPRRMTGDAPGTAPLYISVYEDPALRQLAPDGSGQLTLLAEYWTFYPADRGEAKIFNIIPTPNQFDFTGHRSDWEHTAYTLRVRLGPGSVFQGGDLVEGVFWGHGKPKWIDGPDIERVDDAGRPDPNGTHPVVYVSQGKHACYPQAGEWRDHSFPTWVAEHTDFFRGNGVAIPGWQVPLLDLDDPAGNPAEFHPPEFQAILNRLPVPNLPNWTEYQGRWGPDLQVLSLPTIVIGLGTSSTGAKQKPYYNDFNGRGSYPRWVDMKASQSRLKVYKDHGITIPQASNAAPIRR